MSDEIKLTKEEEENIIENNKYLNKEFDISEILAFGKIPEFENAADRFICTRQVSFFIRKNGLGNHDNLIKFLKSIPTECQIIFLKQLDLQTMETMIKNPKYSFLVNQIIKVVV